MSLPSTSTLIDRLQTAISAAGVDASVGNVLYDVSIASPAVEMGNIYVVQQFLQNVRSIAGFQAMLLDEGFLDSLASALSLSRTESTAFAGAVSYPVDSDFDAFISMFIDLLCSDFGTSRKEPTYAQTILRFYCSASVLTTINALQAQTLTHLLFQESGDVSSPVLPQFDGVNYYIDRVALAVVAGKVTLPPDAVKYLMAVTTNVSGVTNPDPIVSGSDWETNDELLARLLDIFTGTKTDSYNGMTAIAESVVGVQQAYVVSTENYSDSREEDGGISLYVIGSIPVASSFVITLEATTKVPFEKQPVIPDMITLTKVGGDGVLNTGSCVFNQDTGVFAGTVRGYDNEDISVTCGAGESVQVQVDYFYNKLIHDVQDVFDNDDYRVPGIGVDTLAKNGVSVNVYLKFPVLTVFSGYVESEVHAACFEAVSSYVADKGFGALFQESDVIAIMEGVPGVNRVNLPLLAFRVEGESIGLVDNIIQLEGKQYGVLVEGL